VIDLKQSRFRLRNPHAGEPRLAGRAAKNIGGGFELAGAAASSMPCAVMQAMMTPARAGASVAVVFLLADEAPYITGACLPVDRGRITCAAPGAPG
jgi:NAD(P)-dependent dehydrogenase (short-subunit alcohol dehydrogenase family)